jgi:phage terminase small subunit
MPHIKPRKASTPSQIAVRTLPAEYRYDIFAREFVKDFNGKEAVIRCGFNTRSPSVIAAQLLGRSDVRALIEKLVSDRRERLQVAADDIASYWFKLATADARELCPVIVACCRNCYGDDHEHQYTPAEFRSAQRRHLSIQLKKIDSERVPFDERGGSGYDFTLPPLEDCPECHGRGVNQVVPVDLNRVSEGAALLFDGYKYGKDAVEIKLRDRSKAMENLSNMLGLNRSRPVRSFNFDDMTDDELDAAIESAVRRRLVNPSEIIDA